MVFRVSMLALWLAQLKTVMGERDPMECRGQQRVTYTGQTFWHEVWLATVQFCILRLDFLRRASILISTMGTSPPLPSLAWHSRPQGSRPSSWGQRTVRQPCSRCQLLLVLPIRASQSED
ncbi:UNVERIFIED_CONTAM: hypothetical protein FKN15_024594 [Acipenser sinensis]